MDNCFSPVSFHITFHLYVPAPKVPFLKFINVFIKFFGWHWRITLYMFQVCSSAAYHLYVAWCTHHQSLVSCCHQSFAPLSSRYPPSSLFPSGNHHAFDCVFQFVCLFCSGSRVLNLERSTSIEMYDSCSLESQWKLIAVLHTNSNLTLNHQQTLSFHQDVDKK